MGARTGAVVCVLNFALYFLEALFRLDVARMDHPIETHGVVVHLNELVVLQIKRSGHISREDHRHRVVKVRFECLLQALKIEGVPDKVLVHLHEDVVVFELAEPTDPALCLCLLLEDRSFGLGRKRAYWEHLLDCVLL